jgi:erythritol transport system ATP-binding protein
MAGGAVTGVVILRAEQVTKVFPGTVALQDVDFEVRAGAVNVLVGENGAGKSTLMKILAGVERPSSGRLLLDGKEVTFHSVRDAGRHGIGIIFQELNLCPNLSVAENLFISHPPLRFGIDIDAKAQVERARALLKRLEQEIDPEILVADLRIGQQQIVEIAKALAEEVRILIMDEPTSALSATEVDVLFRVIREIKAAGVAIIYISHRLEELGRIGDTVTVLRDGKLQATAPMAEATIPWIIAKMVGPMLEASAVPAAHADRAPMLEVEELRLARASGGFTVDHVSLSVAAGEVVGIYGLLGAGRSELFECLMGLQPMMKGAIKLDGKPVDAQPISARIRAGLALVPEDRQREGLVQSLSVGKNLTLASLWRFLRGLSIAERREREAISGIIKSLWIKVSSPEVEVTALSGGNQQKVVIGKTLLTRPKVLLLDEPSRGIDIGAKMEVFRTMRKLAEDGLAVLFSTSDLMEVMAVADRILVMSNGKLTGDFKRAEATEAALVAASTRNLRRGAEAA